MHTAHVKQFNMIIPVKQVINIHSQEFYNSYSFNISIPYMYIVEPLVNNNPFPRFTATRFLRDVPDEHHGCWRSFTFWSNYENDN